MKNISKQYQDLLEGKMSRDNFVRNCRQQFPQFVSPVTSIDDAIKILKGKRIIAEAITDRIRATNRQGYLDNYDGFGLDYCPYDDPKEAASWKEGWMEAETEKQMEHDEETYNRETGGYGDLYKENANNDRRNIDEMDINDPVLMATRARKDRESAPQYQPTVYKNADKLKALQMKRAQIMRDMEQEAELEGGPIADMYGTELEKIDRAISMMYENKKKSLKEAAEKSEGKYKEVTGKDLYGKFPDLDNVNFTTFLRAVAFEVSKNPVVNDDNLPSILEKVAKAMKKDPMAYRDLVIANTKDIAKQDETLKMREVKPGNMVDKDNGMQEIKGQEKYKADNAPKTEYRKGKPEGVKEMGITPKKAPGITKVMDMPGKEKVLSQLKESLRKRLSEDTHHKYTPGSEVETPDGQATVVSVFGGTVTVKLANGQEADYQFNVLDHIANKAQASSNPWNKLQAYSPKSQDFLRGQMNEDDASVEQALEAALKSHDWYYRMSDDPRAYDRGDDENSRISQLMKQLPRETAIALYNKYSPWKLEERSKSDKYSKLKEYLKKAIKKEAMRFNVKGKDTYIADKNATGFEQELKAAGITQYTKTKI
jgi:ribosome modulation factor